MIRAWLATRAAYRAGLRYRAARIRQEVAQQLPLAGTLDRDAASTQVLRLRWQTSLLLDAISGRPYQGPTPRGLE